MAPTEAPLSIFVIANNPSDFKRMPIASALHSSGHKIAATQEADPAKVLDELKAFRGEFGCDLILVFMWSFMQPGGRHLDQDGFERFWREIDVPTVVLWDDNPLRWVALLNHFKPVTRTVRHLIIDSEVVDAMNALGLPSAYFPIYFVHPSTMLRDKPSVVPDVDVLLCGNAADPERYIALLHTLIPNRADDVVRAARAFLELKRSNEQYVDTLSFARGCNLELDPFVEAEFCRILTGLQRTADRVNILQKLPKKLRVGVVGHDVSAPGIPGEIQRYPSVKYSALGHIYSLPIAHFGTSGWPAACNLRLFQAAAFGGMMFHESNVDAKRHFGPEATPFLFDNSEDLVQRIEHCVSDPTPFAKAAAAMKQRFDREHSVMHRAKQLVSMLRA